MGGPLGAKQGVMDRPNRTCPAEFHTVGELEELFSITRSTVYRPGTPERVMRRKLR
jgi:hypothetical protein